MVWAPATTSTTATKWQTNPPDPDWWDGSAVQPANVYWWDGVQLQVPTIEGWWDGSSIQPLA